MIRRTYALSFLACLVVLAAALAGCSGKEVGRKCDLGLTPAEGDSVVASPSLDCVSRVCLKIPKQDGSKPEDSKPPTGNIGLCTDECEADEECERVPESPCETGFTCGIPVTVGPFCCKKFCMCKDYVVVPEGGQPLPAACEDKPENTCCNLPGRAACTAF